MKSIIFSTNDVTALLNTKPGTWPAEPIDPSRPFKCQTRRVMKPQPILEPGKPGFWSWKDCQWADGGLGFPESGIADHAPCKVGDIFWVRETWRCMGFDDDDKKILVQYKDETSRWVSFDDVTRWKKFAVCSARWKPSIHMPLEAARLFLEVREVRVERLRDISHLDVMAEGLQQKECGCEVVTGGYCTVFREFWNAVNGKGAWESNPWVWVYSFMRVEKSK